MGTYFIETWGCQMNVHDSERLAGILAGLGYAPAAAVSEADVILLNTCTVREKAAEKIFSRLGELRALKLARPETLLGVCGCVAQQEKDAVFRRAPYVDLVMGPRHVARLPELLATARREGRSIGLAREDEPAAAPAAGPSRGAGPRAWVTVMEGCNKTCTYCIVPYVRGGETYRPAADILAEAAALPARGYSEIELLGQNVNAWHEGSDDFATLLRRMDRIPGLRRLRFTTSHPGHLKAPIMDALRDLDSACPHLHLPAQSGSDAILKTMNRGYTRDLYLGRIDALRRRIPEIALSTDLIVGFPGETDADFEATLTLMRRAGFDQVFAFIYSPRPGTPAFELREVPEAERQARLATLLALQEALQAPRQAALIGRTFEVLIDGASREPGVMKGRTRCNRIVHVASPEGALRRGDFVAVRIARAFAHSLSGAPVDAAGAA